MKMEYMGIELTRNSIPFEMNECHDESISFEVCQRFYGKDKELDECILKAKKDLKEMLINRQGEIELMHAFIGNLLYLRGDYAEAAGYHMNILSVKREDITPWVELIFCLRGMGKFELFEDAIFSLGWIYNRWKHDPERKMTQKKFIELVEDGKLHSQDNQ